MELAADRVAVVAVEVRAVVVVVVRAAVVVVVRAAVAVAVAAPVAVVVVAAVVVVTRDPSRSSRFVAVRASSRVDVASAFRPLLLSATRTVESAGGMVRRPRFLWLSRRRSRTPTET